MALVLVAMTQTLAFAGKPTVAVLGLEVIDPSGNIDQVSTTVAHDLTEGLRLRAKVPSGPYQLQPGSDKELIDQKLIKSCDNEAIACMAEIGRDLGADFLIYGRLEKKAEGYVVTINLLNVNKKRFEKAKTPLVIPNNQKDSTSIASSAKRAYNDLTGLADLGSLVIRTNAGVDRGSVLLDDAPRGTLSSGSATIRDLPEGRYRLVIEADGWQRSKETTVTIRSGETTTQPVTLVEKPDSSSEGTKDPDPIGVTGSYSEDHSNGWKKVAIIGGLGTIGLGIGFGVSWNRLTKTGADGTTFGYGQFCSDGAEPGVAHQPGHLWSTKRPSVTDADCQSAQFYNTATYVTGIAMTLGLGVTVWAIYKSLRSDDNERPPAGATTVGRRSKPRRDFRVTPVLSPDGGGATVQFDW